MAELKYEGVDGLLSVMMNKDAKLAARIEKALELSGIAAQEQLRKEAASSFKQPTGKLASLVKPGVPKRGNGAAWIEVWAQGDYYGKRGKKRRAETVAFVMEYGVEPYKMENGKFKGATRGRQAPNPWHKRASRRSKKRISSIIAEVMGDDA